MVTKENTKSEKKKTSVGVIAACGLFVAVALIFSYIESLLPIPFPVPGMKLGFANIAILAVLYLYGAKHAFIVNITRILLAVLLFGHGNIPAFFFSLAGGVASLGVMCLLKRFGNFSIIPVSAAGGVIHNVAQILISIWILGSVSIGFLLPVFIILGLVTGIICGIVTRIFLKHVRRMHD